MAGNVINKQEYGGNEVREALEANYLAKDTRECMQYLHYWFEATYQIPISISIFLEFLLSILKQC
jgi:hypothetical protein